MLAKEAFKLGKAYTQELTEICNYLYDKVMLIMDNIMDPASRRSALKEVLNNPMTGLCKSESNMLLAKLCPNENVKDIGFMTSFKKDLDERSNNTPKTRQRRQNTFKHMKEELLTLLRRVRETTIKRSLF